LCRIAHKRWYFGSAVKKKIENKGQKKMGTVPKNTLSIQSSLTLFELTVDGFPAPANRVATSGQLSMGRLQASTDQGALSYNLMEQLKTEVQTKC
jgi:uncharacterized protein involved in outer membrane biogenesis